jgi:hypothetical protein
LQLAVNSKTEFRLPKSEILAQKKKKSMQRPKNIKREGRCRMTRKMKDGEGRK